MTIVIKRRPNESTESLFKRFRARVAREGLLEEIVGRMRFKDKSKEKIERLKRVRFLAEVKRKKEL